MNIPPIRPAPEDADENPDDLPVINIDEDPDNANWIRILEQRRRKDAGEQQQPQQQPPQKS